jgi:hypothetical protein
MPSKRRPQARRGKQPRTRKKTRSKLSPGSYAARLRVLHALSLMRDQGISLSHACKSAGVSIPTFLKYAHGAIRRDRLGRYIAKPSDNLKRDLKYFRADGEIIDITVRGSREATLLSKWWIALGEYARTGDLSVFHELKGKRVGGHILVTDRATLRSLLESEFDLGESIYSQLSGGAR